MPAGTPDLALTHHYATLNGIRMHYLLEHLARATARV
jgi:hypothetical protein